MSFFLKKSYIKNKTYLQIYQSFRNENGRPSHKSYKALGYTDDLINKGIDDPVAFYKKEVNRLNAKVKKEKEEALIKKVADSPIRNAGCFLIYSVFNKLGLKAHLDLIDKIYEQQLSTYDYILNMVSARIVNPCSKLKTFEEVLPSLFNEYRISKDQVYDKLAFIGDKYENILEIFNNFYNEKYPRKTGKVYFDCTNYYFEIDAEDDLRRKGPSKENRKDPIIGMGLLLDEEQIPLTMSLYPGNESEKPEIRKCIKDMKERYHLSGRTIQVADKGLNCSKNIYEALKNGDGYIYSQSVKKLEDKEQIWVLLDNDYKEVKDDSGNLLFKYKSCTDEFTYSFDGTKFVTKQKRVATYNPSLAAKQLTEINKLIEKAKSLSNYENKKKEYGESAKYVTFKVIKEDGKTDDETIVTACLNQSKIEKDKKLCGYNMLTSSELKMNSLDIYNVYHRLWRIEETFKTLKSELDARPVYCQKKETIYGHFLICYLSVFILRTLQIKKFGDKIHVNQIIDFIRSFNVLKEQKDRIINLSTKDKILPFKNLLKLNIDNYYFSEKDLDKLFTFKI